MMARTRKIALGGLAVVIAAAGILCFDAWRTARIRSRVERLSAGLLSEDESEVRAAVARLREMKSHTAAEQLLAIYIREGPPDMNGPALFSRWPYMWRLSDAWEVKRLDRVLPAVFEGMGEPAVGPLLDALMQKEPWIERLRRSSKSRLLGRRLEFTDKNGDLICLAETSLA